MGFDIYCAFCGTSIGQPWWMEGSDPDSYDTDILTQDDISWLNDVKLIGENPDCQSVSKVFISGEARHEDYGNVIFVPGPDPHAPAAVPGRQSQLIVYRLSGSEPFAAPFHTACFELFQQCLAPEAVDNEILYETIKSLSSETTYSRLAVDYGPVADLQEQFWVVQRGTEDFVSPFLTIPWLNQYYTSLPQRNDSSREFLLSASSESSSDHTFAQFPVEVILLIMSNLNMKDVYCLQRSSRHLFQIGHNSSFWRQRFLRDMPWLFDFPKASLGSSVSSVDWTRAYRDLMLASEYENPRKVRGLVNRRRIWNLCESLADAYTSRKMASAAIEYPSTIIDVSSTPSVLLIFPDPSNCTSSTICLLEDFPEIFYQTPTISVHWTSDGQLAALQVQGRASTTPSALRDDVCVPKNDWITGFVVYSQISREANANVKTRCVVGLQILFAKQDSILLRETGGDKRLMRVSLSHFLVGFKTHISEDGHLAKLALLQQPISKLPYGAEPRVKDEHEMDYNPEACKFLWENQIPGQPLIVSDFQHGYWSHDLRTDVSAMEVLILGNSDDELADITAIGVDVHFGGFEVQYASRPSRFIGPRRYAMQYLHIDGRGGERLVCMYWSVGHIPIFVRLLTNRGRQLVVGRKEAEKRYPSSDNTGNVLAGIFSHWSKTDQPQANLEGIGGLYIPNQAAADASNAVLSDGHGFYWSPESPAPLIESGKIWGERVEHDPHGRHDKTYPAEGSIVSWLDCRGPLQVVKVSLCHGTPEDQIPLLAMSLISASQIGNMSQHKSIGPTVFSQPSDTGGKNGHHWCWCHYGKSRADEFESRPHHVHETWEVGGQNLRSLRIWLSTKGAIAGLQFVAEDGSESPRWGYCVGDCSGSIDFMGDQEEGGAYPVALKFFLAGNERRTSRDDTIVIAVQALSQAR